MLQAHPVIDGKEVPSVPDKVDVLRGQLNLPGGYIPKLIEGWVLGEIYGAREVTKKELVEFAEEQGVAGKSAVYKAVTTLERADALDVTRRGNSTILRLRNTVEERIDEIFGGMNGV